jgi:gliding motility-associated-like protein
MIANRGYRPGGGDGNTAITQNPKHAYKSFGDYIVTLVVNSQNGCSSTTFSKSLHINQKPVSAFSYSLQDCATQSITVTDASSSKDGTINKWAWDFGDGSVVEIMDTNTSFMHTYNSAGTYTVKLQTTSTYGCVSDAYSTPIIIHPLPVINMVLPGICLNDASALFTNQSTVADSTIDQLTYQWTFGDDVSNVNTNNPNTSTAKNPSHKYVAAKNYALGLTVTSKYGCTVHKDTTFTVNGDNPIANFSVLNANVLCSDHEVFIVNHSSVDFGKVLRIDVYFDANDPTTLKSYFNPTDGELLRYTYPKFYSGTQNHTIRMIAYSGTVCSSNPKDVTITLLSVSQLVWPVIKDVCQEIAPIQLQASQLQGPNGNGGVYSGVGVSSTGVFNPALAGPGKHVITFIYTPINNCADTLTQEITVNPTPMVFAGRDTLILVGTQIQLQGTADGKNLTYKWTTSGGKAQGLDHDDTLNPIASPLKDIRYILTAISSDGCTSSSSVFITVLESPVVPSGFTPNGDGINDTWNIKNLNSYKNCTVQIFTRYGEMIFSSVGYSVPWDGKYQGRSLPVGTYYYIINPKNGRKVLSGPVTIIR